MLITEWLIVIQIYKNRAKETNIWKKVYANAYPIFMDIKKWAYFAAGPFKDIILITIKVYFLFFYNYLL